MPHAVCGVVASVLGRIRGRDPAPECRRGRRLLPGASARLRGAITSDHTSFMTPLRKKILALARKFDGTYMTADQAMWLSSTMGSMDDTLTDDEVWMFLSNISNK